MQAHRLRGERGDHHIAEEHLADAIELLMQTRERLPG
jgi:glyoxalase family protein